MRETVDWLSKFFAIAFVELVLITVMLLCGIILQTVAGFYHYELIQYCQEFYLIVFPGVMAYTLLAFFVQTMVSNKFIGHAIIVGVFFSSQVLPRFNFEDSLYVPMQTTPYIYSDMNRYGHFVAALFWSNVYWLAIVAALAVFSIALTRRGAEDSWSARWIQGRRRLPGLTPAIILFVLIALGSGSWFFYNTRVLNTLLYPETAPRLPSPIRKGLQEI